jgi:4-amino-4-deoxy-L-arabinose transferase-like glycosyltransferase
MRMTPLIAVFVAAFLVRLWFNVYIMGMDNTGIDRFPDGKDYDALALSLAGGTGYAIDHIPNTFRPPGYPLFLAAVYALAGHSYAVVKVLQSLIGALTCVLVVMIGERLFSKRTGVIAGVIAAVYPFLVLYSGFLLSEILFVFLSMAFIYALLRLRGNWTWWGVAIAGLVLGLMNLTRPVALLLPGLLFFWLWGELGAKRRAAMIAGLLALWMLVPIVPWTIRNYVVTHSLILIDDHHWLGLYIGNNRTIMETPDKIGGWLEPALVEGARESFQAADYRSAYVAFLKDQLLQQPLDLLRLEGYKLIKFWNVVPTSSKTTPRDAMISILSYGLLLPLALLGVALSFKSAVKPWLLIIWILNFCLVTLIAFGSTRFRAPVEPVLILFGALALEKAWMAWVSA